MSKTVDELLREIEAEIPNWWGSPYIDYRDEQIVEDNIDEARKPPIQTARPGAAYMPKKKQKGKWHYKKTTEGKGP